MQPSLPQRLLRAGRLAAAALSFGFFLTVALFADGRMEDLATAWHPATGAVRAWFAAQAGPALLRVFASFSAGALAVALAHVAAALVFGRLFCATLCPLGIAQDVVAGASRRLRGRRRAAREDAAAFARRSRRERAVRLVAAGLAFGALAAGAAWGFLALDPYSTAMRAATALHRGPFLAGAVLPAAAVLAAAAWRGRPFCTALCPVGTALGLLSRAAPFRLRLAGSCVRCGACAAACPAHCIDLATGRIDNERCVRCLACVSACKVRGIAYAPPRRRRDADPADVPPAVPFSDSRRAFQRGAATLAAGLATGAAVARAGARRAGAAARRRLSVLPPGAGSPERFATRCTGCLRCVAACPEGLIRPAKGGLGPVRLALSEGACRYHCHRCATACPTGAIRRMPLADKQRTRIAQVEFHADHCIVFQCDEWCGKCLDACPTGAIAQRRNGTPKISHPERCIGCGACQRVCPGFHADGDPEGAFPKAMRIAPLPDGLQSRAEAPDPDAVPDPPRPLPRHP